MTPTYLSKAIAVLTLAALLGFAAVASAVEQAVSSDPAGEVSQGGAEDTASELQGVVRAAKLIYANGKTSVCFSDQFLTETAEQTSIATHPQLIAVRSDSAELFDYPFAVMTGEGAFTLTDAQVDTLRTYLTCGGFVIASAGCSSKDWNASFAVGVARIFPGSELTTLGPEHPIYHTVYDINSSQYKSGGARLPELQALELDGRVVLVWSPDGLNDTANAGGNCCCCGGNEVKSAKLLNVNILAYALTH